jgi:HTH-type transcriptional regulator/antitoxin HigA
METALVQTGGVAVGLIKNDEQLDDALAEFSALLDLDDRRTPDQDDRYQLLELVIRHYETTRYRFARPDPVDAITFEMEQRNLRPRDLIPYLGSRSRVSEVLAKKRRLTLKMMRALHAGLGIPYEILVQEYELGS